MCLSHIDRGTNLCEVRKRWLRSSGSPRAAHTRQPSPSEAPPPSPPPSLQQSQSPWSRPCSFLACLRVCLLLLLVRSLACGELLEELLHLHIDGLALANRRRGRRRCDTAPSPPGHTQQTWQVISSVWGQESTVGRRACIFFTASNTENKSTKQCLQLTIYLFL